MEANENYTTVNISPPLHINKMTHSLLIIRAMLFSDVYREGFVTCASIMTFPFHLTISSMQTIQKRKMLYDSFFHVVIVK